MKGSVELAWFKLGEAGLSYGGLEYARTWRLEVTITEPNTRFNRIFNFWRIGAR